jgi:transposase
MKAYSQDLRERVIAAVETGAHSRPELAETFRVSESTIDKWTKRWRDTGRVAALPFAGGRRRALQPCAANIRAEVEQQADVTLDELCERIEAQTDVIASPSMMARELKVLVLSRKKRPSMTAPATHPV